MLSLVIEETSLPTVDEVELLNSFLVMMINFPKLFALYLENPANVIRLQIFCRIHRYDIEMCLFQ